jgi:hypothetical protein
MDPMDLAKLYAPFEPVLDYQDRHIHRKSLIDGMKSVAWK